MTTLIAAYNSDGCVGRCDARCHQATTPECDCICGGMNHSVGLRRAAANTQAMAETWIDQYNEEHPLSPLRWEVPASEPIQFPLFESV